MTGGADRVHDGGRRGAPCRPLDRRGGRVRAPRSPLGLQFLRSRRTPRVLAVISLMCGFLVGYEMGATEAPSRAHMLVLAAILSFTFCVILDFEYPRLGLIRIDDFDQLIADVRATMG